VDIHGGSFENEIGSRMPGHRAVVAEQKATPPGDFPERAAARHRSHI